MHFNILFLIIGFALLIKGADFFVEGASSLAKKLKIPALIIGLTIAAFGTSAPELFISSISSFQGISGLTLGNVLGSNIANILLILGLIALLNPLKADSKIIVREIPFLFVTSLALWAVSDDMLFGGEAIGYITRGEALVLLLLFSIFMYYLIFESLKIRSGAKIAKEFKEPKQGTTIHKRNWIIITSLISGFLMLAFGGKLVVDNSTIIASALGLSDALIGLTIVAMGTSLPELVTSLVAVFKKEHDVAIGNIVGSSIFNTVAIIGVAGAIHPIEFSASLRPDILFMIGISIVLFIFALSNKKIDKKEGVALLLTYAAYIIFIMIRG